jgi:exodeoxyribonuclease-3
MRIVSWNINGIRARHARVLAWLARHRPDVVLLQETKCTDESFRALAVAYAAVGYQSVHHGHDHWNGVAILSRVGIVDVRRGFPGTNRAPYDEARVVAATCGGIDVHSVYAPNGRTLDDPHYLFKLVWLERLRTVVVPGRPTILAGDLNVAPSDLDVYDPVRWRRRTHASPPERAAITALLDVGLVDVTRRHLPGAGVYTWWSYRAGQFAANRGLRIDLALCTPDITDRISRVWIDVDERRGGAGTEAGALLMPKPSDHAPVVIELDGSDRAGADLGQHDRPDHDR